MKPVLQTHTKPPVGNCFAACVASIFEVEIVDVPNFLGGAGKWWTDWCAWLAGHNIYMSSFELTPGVRPWAHTWTIATVDSRRGDWKHAVVFFGSSLQHDPWPFDEGKWIDPGNIVYDFVLFYPIDPSKPALIPRSGAFARDHDPELIEAA